MAQNQWMLDKKTTHITKELHHEVDVMSSMLETTIEGIVAWSLRNTLRDWDNGLITAQDFQKKNGDDNE